MYGGVWLLVAPSQARGDFRVTPSVCLSPPRHPHSPERATCLPRPSAHLSWPAWLLPQAPCPWVDTAGLEQDWEMAAGRWQG